MRSRLTADVLTAILVALLLAACDKAPRGVIGEHKMTDLLTDLYLADSYAQTYGDRFPDDSSRQVLKQRIYARHHVTAEDFDASMDWYGHHVNVYLDVHDKVIQRLKERKGDVSQLADVPAALPAQQQSYNTAGDTADLWQMRRQWMITEGMGHVYVPFNISPDPDYRPGDRYHFRFKLLQAAGTEQAVLAVDYGDGGTTQASRSVLHNGWNNVELQTDTLRQVRRIYGYLSFLCKPRRITYADSLSLLRTHRSDATYNSIHNQRLFERMSTRKPAPDALHEHKRIDTLHRFTPKPGIHKSSVSHPDEHSPNAAHLPSNAR